MLHKLYEVSLNDSQIPKKKHILVIATDHCNSELSKKNQFEKSNYSDFLIFINYLFFFQSLKLVIWTNCTFRLSKSFGSILIRAFKRKDKLWRSYCRKHNIQQQSKEKTQKQMQNVIPLLLEKIHYAVAKLK